VIALPHMPSLNLPRQPAGRIALAVVLSALVHAITLFTPLVELPESKAPLPPLIARLEPLPVPPAKPAPPEKSKPPKPKPKPKPRPQPAPVMAREPAPEAEPVVVAQEEAPQTDAVPQPAAAGTIEEPAEEARPAHPLPRHAQLTFVAYKGKDFAIGEAHHTLEIDENNNYILKVGMNTTGLASLFKSYESEQRSSGTLTDHGLRPARFIETKNNSSTMESSEATFFWKAKSLTFSNGGSTQLPEQTQDIISFLYQLSQLALDKDKIPMYISNGKKLERYELAVGEEEMIQTGIGWLRALPLRKIHAQGEEGLDVWLGLEYRLLPVKIRMIDRAGNVAGEMVVSEMRVADE